MFRNSHIFEIFLKLPRARTAVFSYLQWLLRNNLSIAAKFSWKNSVSEKKISRIETIDSDEWSYRIFALEFFSKKLTPLKYALMQLLDIFLSLWLISFTKNKIQFNFGQTSIGNVLIAGLENEDMTPTLKQLWVTVRQLQQDMAQAKVQINEERALRCHLQQMLMGHLESVCISSNPSGGSNWFFFDFFFLF